MHVRRSIAVAAVAALTAGIGGFGALGPADAANIGSSGLTTIAGTLVYIKDNNVWLSNGDGSSARPITSNGTETAPYASPSQSDQGIIAAGHLDNIVRMDQSGYVLNTMNPPPLPSTVTQHPIDGNLQEVAISPDGSLIAYSVSEFLTPPGSSPGYRFATGYTSAASFTDPATYGTTFFDEPSWVGNNRTLQSGGFGNHVTIDDLGPAEPAVWFNSDDFPPFPIEDLGNATLTRDGRYVAAVGGHGDSYFVYWYKVVGDATQGGPPGLPEPECEIGPAATMTDPTWAPDSDTLAWVEADGIWVRSDASNCQNFSERLLIPGGSQPNWSPAPLSPPTHSEQPVVAATTTAFTLDRDSTSQNGAAVTATATVAVTGGAAPNGQFSVVVDGAVGETKSVTPAGATSVTFALPVSKPGSHQVQVRYLGSSTQSPSVSTPRTYTVAAKETPPRPTSSVVRAAFQKAQRHTLLVAATVTSSQPVTGRVQVVQTLKVRKPGKKGKKGKKATYVVKRKVVGSATIKKAGKSVRLVIRTASLKKGRHTLTVRYLGSSKVLASARTYKVRVS